MMMRDRSLCKPYGSQFLFAGIAALLMGAGWVLPVSAKTHAVNMTAVETDVVIDGSGEKQWPWSLAAGEPLPPGVLELLAPYRVPAA